MVEREVVRETRPTEREVVVDEGPRRGGGGGVVAAVVAIVLVLILGWFLLNVLGILGGAAEDAAESGTGAEVNVEAEE